MNLKKFYMNSLMQDLTAFGTIYHLVILIAILISFNEQQLAYKLIIGQIIMYLFAVPLKLFLFKNRPKKIMHKNIIEKIEASSFPSVHTLRIFFVSAVLINFFNNVILTVILSFLSLAVAYSRIYLKKHHFIDIIGGAFLGVLLGYGVINYV